MQSRSEETSKPEDTRPLTISDEELSEYRDVENEEPGLVEKPSRKEPVQTAILLKLFTSLVSRKFGMPETWQDEYMATVMPWLQMLDSESLLENLDVTRLSPGARAIGCGIVLVVGFALTKPKKEESA